MDLRAFVVKQLCVINSSWLPFLGSWRYHVHVMLNSFPPTNHIKDGMCTMGVANQMWWTNHSVTCKDVFLLNSHSHSYLTKSLRLIRSMPYEMVNPFTYITTIYAVCQQSKYLTPPDLGTTLCKCIDILVVGLKGIKEVCPYESKTSRKSIRLLSAKLANSRNFSGIERSCLNSLPRIC